MSTAVEACNLCRDAGGEVLFEHRQLRVVLVEDGLYPGFCRVIWNSHVREMTDLQVADRNLFMCFVWAVEEAVRAVLCPEKINLASLGNLTPHPHWHVIARHLDDAHFPQPIWGTQQRPRDSAAFTMRAALLPQLRQAVSAQCAALQNGLPVG
ncbi:MAG: HIT family protein [Burkholderiaceae bacterium]